MTQTTSVNVNASLNLKRDGFPSGAYTITLRTRFDSWGAAAGGDPDLAFILRAQCDGGSWRAYASFPGNTINASAGSVDVISPSADFTDWGMLYVRWAGTGQAVKIGFIPDGGTAIELVGGTFFENLGELQTSGLDFYPAGTPDQLHLCTETIWSGYLSDAELAAQQDSDVAIDTSGGSGATLWAFYPMASAATAGTDTSGNGRHQTVTGTGITVSDVPDAYLPSVHDLGASDLATDAPALGSAALGQAHALGSTALSSGTPSLGFADLTQAHALGAVDLTCGTPTLGTPALGIGTHDLVASSLEAGTPALGSATLTQSQALGASELTAGSPLLGSPAINRPSETRLRVNVEAPRLLVSVSSPRLLIEVSP